MKQEELEKEYKGTAKEICDFLKERIKTDSFLKEKLFSNDKGIDDCASYIISKARENAQGEGSVMIEDETVYNWIVHYFTEDSIVKGTCAKAIKGKSEPKQTIKPKKGKTLNGQMSLFDIYGK